MHDILYNKKQTSFHGSKCVLRGRGIGTEQLQWYNSYVLASSVVDIELEPSYQRIQLQSN